MIEKPQKARADGQGDILDQIIAQGLEKITSPAQTAAPEAVTPPEPKQGGGASAPPADRKARRSAVYLYLLVLFGAAFLMLVLAYFVQRRSSEDAISDLQASINLSREELLIEIQDLKNQSSALEKENSTLKNLFASAYSDLTRLREQYEDIARAAVDAGILGEDFLSRPEDWQEVLYQYGSDMRYVVVLEDDCFVYYFEE